MQYKPYNFRELSGKQKRFNGLAVERNRRIFVLNEAEKLARNKNLSYEDKDGLFKILGIHDFGQSISN